MYEGLIEFQQISKFIKYYWRPIVTAAPPHLHLDRLLHNQSSQQQLVIQSAMAHGRFLHENSSNVVTQRVQRVAQVPSVGKGINRYIRASEHAHQHARLDSKISLTV